MRARLVTAVTAAVVALVPATLALGTAPAVAGGDPGGNNGTVKIAESNADETTANDPHVGCTFTIRWFGFDEGSDIVSAVSFASQAPTAAADISVDGPRYVSVGGDAAGGGTDLDGEQDYTLTFSGAAPQANQGYHVKVTVATPGSRGNDTKSKVVWVRPCETGTVPETPGTPETPETPAVPPFHWDWEYADPTCAGVTVAYPANIPEGQANDVNVRVETEHGQQTLNFHKNEGFWGGTTPFVLADHPQWHGGAAEYHITWVQVGGTNYHWQGDVGCLTDGDPGTSDVPVGMTTVDGFTSGTATVARGRSVAADVVTVAQAGDQDLSLQQWRTGSWATVRTIAAEGGTAKVTFPRLTRRGTYKFRLAVAGSEATTGDTTGVLTVRVR
jgi:hypothetical protein